VQSPKTTPLAQADASQQPPSAQATNNQQKEEPTSLEMFSAFLDRG
jgi:hypothetical protein